MRDIDRDVVLDGEAAAHNDDGLPDFNHFRTKRGSQSTYLFVFDLLAIDGMDLRERLLLERRSLLAELLKSPPDAIRFSEDFEADGATLFEHACRLGLEGIVSKRLALRSRPSSAGVKTKNPDYRR